MNPTSISFDDATKQTSRSRNLTTVLENIGKPARYVLPPGGTITCRKWRVCTDLKNAHAILCDSIVKIFLFELKGNRRFFNLQ